MKKLTQFVFSFLFLFSLIGCASSASGIKGEAKLKVMEGTWKSDATTARMKISIHETLLLVEAWDESDGEKFEINTYSWDGKVLDVKMTMPSTSHTTTSRFSIIDQNKLKDVYSGDSQGQMVWTRVTGE